MSLRFQKFLLPFLGIDCSEITMVVSRICSREAQGKWWGGCKGKPILYKRIFITTASLSQEAILGHGTACKHDHMHLIESVLPLVAETRPVCAVGTLV